MRTVLAGALTLLLGPTWAFAQQAAAGDERNSFEETRFFIDKIDTDATADRTLVQGTFTSTSLFYAETGGELAGLAGNESASIHSRLFTDLRAQLDARHIAGGKWDVRIDGRARVVTDPPNTVGPDAGGMTPPLDYGTRVQSGVFGRNEYDLRELWLVRSGKRSDIFLGRQFIADLAAVKIDGLRVDYAQSSKFTILGFAGAHPMRTSRSVGFDYPVARIEGGERIGRIIPLAFGGGAAYRTGNAYGSFGGVAIYPLPPIPEQPRVFATASGYWRQSPKLDLYHFGVLDLYGKAGFQVTNLSLGLQYRPARRFRANASINRVDTDTLSSIAQTYLKDNDGATVIRNDTEILRIASDQARAGVSLALGRLESLELSSSIALRRRPEITVLTGQATGANTAKIAATQSADVQFSVVHRRLFRDLRVGIDAVRSFGVGDVPFARSEYLSVRAHASREFRQGRGQWEAEIGYAQVDEGSRGATCVPTSTATILDCFGAANSRRLDAAGTVYYRLTPSFFAVGSLSTGRLALTTVRGGMATADPNLLQFSGFLRLGFRY